MITNTITPKCVIDYNRNKEPHPQCLEPHPPTYLFIVEILEADIFEENMLFDFFSIVLPSTQSNSIDTHQHVVIGRGGKGRGEEREGKGRGEVRGEGR